jgi:MSHA biogenesis protein MshG
MIMFRYEGRDSQGQLVKGELNASSVEAVVDELSRENIIPVDITVAKGKVKPFAFLKKNIFIGKIKTEELISFCRQMYSLTKAGIPLVETLTLILETTHSSLLKECLDGIINDITAGKTLTSAMNKYPKVFSSFFVSLIHAGENTGQLETIFLQLSEYLELIDRTEKQVKTALRYPALVLVAITTALLVVNFFVIPNFVQIFSRFGVVLPVPTRILFSTSNVLIHNWMYFFIIVLMIIVSVRLYLKTDKGRYYWDALILKIPIFGQIVQRVLLGRFARSFSMIFRTGVPLVQGIELVANIVDNEYMRRHVLAMRDGVERGETLTKAATDTQLFSPMVLQMFSTGEESGTVDTLLQEAAEFYERRVEYDLKRLADYIEPILLVMLGLMVLTLALGIFLPMWDMVQFVRQ